MILWRHLAMTQVHSSARRNRPIRPVTKISTWRPFIHCVTLQLFLAKKTRFFNRLVCAVKNSFLRRPQLQPALTLSGFVASGWNLMGLNLDSFNRGGRGRHVDVIPSKITTWSGRDVTQEKYKTSSFGTSAVCRLFTFFKIRNSRSKAAHPNFPYKLILMNVNAPLNFNSIKSHSLKIKSLFPLYKLN